MPPRKRKRSATSADAGVSKQSKASRKEEPHKDEAFDQEMQLVSCLQARLAVAEAETVITGRHSTLA
ncbi:hypothetical protein ABBQ38_000171 [Trebouxia sp. C0009 RCD-2024]